MMTEKRKMERERERERERVTYDSHCKCDPSRQGELMVIVSLLISFFLGKMNLKIIFM